MEISCNIPSQPSPLRFDLTKPNRDVVKERQPIDQPVKTDADPTIDLEAAAKDVREARDAYRNQRQTRIANARQHYTATHADQFASEVTDARNAYRAKLDERVKNTQPPTTSGGDSVDISNVSKQMVDRATAIARELTPSTQERIAELKALHSEGRLNSDDLIARAAHRMLTQPE